MINGITLLDSLSDNALMLKVKAGNTEQLGLLYERHKQALFGFFYRMTHDGASSEDLVQNVFVKILKYKHTFAGNGKFTTWMYHIARNTSIDYHKKKQKMGRPDDLDKWHDKLEDEDHWEKLQAKNEEERLLQKALQQLSEDKRELLVLSRFQGMKYKEIGELYGLTEGNVKVRIFRALNELKKIYQKLDLE